MEKVRIDLDLAGATKPVVEHYSYTSSNVCPCDRRIDSYRSSSEIVPGTLDQNFSIKTYADGQTGWYADFEGSLGAMFRSKFTSIVCGSSLETRTSEEWRRLGWLWPSWQDLGKPMGTPGKLVGSRTLYNSTSMPDIEGYRHRATLRWDLTMVIR